MINKTKQELGNNSSIIRELFSYGKKRKEEIGSENVFDFSIGNPSVDAPVVVTSTLIELLNNTKPSVLHGYTDAQGDFGVRCEICNTLNKLYDTNYSPNLTYLTVGAAASLTISLGAILNKDDEVIVFTPYFPEYKVFVEAMGGVLKEVSPDNHFKPNLKDLENKITNKTKAIIINSPNNPTGVIYDTDTFKAISNILNKKSKEYNTQIFIISDEVYRELIYTNTLYPTCSKYYNNTIVCYSFSKSLSLPGERIGYIIVNTNCVLKSEVYDAIKGSGRSMGFVCAPALFQYMLPKCLNTTSDLSVYLNNRDTLYNALTNMGYQVIKPDGAFYLFVKALESSGIDFSNKAKDFELLLVPSESFGYPGFVRIAYCVSYEQVEKSLPAFKKLMDFYRGKQ